MGEVLDHQNCTGIVTESSNCGSPDGIFSMPGAIVPLLCKT